MTKEAFKFMKMIERRIHIAQREGDEEVEIMMNKETYELFSKEVLVKLLEKQYVVQLYYNPILFGDSLFGDYQLIVKGFNE